MGGGGGCGDLWRRRWRRRLAAGLRGQAWDCALQGADLAWRGLCVVGRLALRRLVCVCNCALFKLCVRACAGGRAGAGERGCLAPRRVAGR